MRSVITFLTFVLIFAVFVSAKSEDEEKPAGPRTCVEKSDCDKPYESYKCEKGFCVCHGAVYTKDPDYPCFKLIGIGKKCELELQCFYNDSQSECVDDICKCKAGTTKGEDEGCHGKEKVPAALLLFPALFLLAIVGSCIGCVICLVCCCCKKKKVETEIEDD